MTDKRETLLVRLLAIAGERNGVRYTARNELDVSEEHLPAIVLYDADETPAEVEQTRIRDGRAAQVMVMSPQYCIFAIKDSTQIGTDINALLADLRDAVRTDAALRSLCGTNGNVRYAGCQTDLAPGRDMIGRSVVHIAITYILNPAS